MEGKPPTIDLSQLPADRISLAVSRFPNRWLHRLGCRTTKAQSATASRRIAKDSNGSEISRWNKLSSDCAQRSCGSPVIGAVLSTYSDDPARPMGASDQGIHLDEARLDARRAAGCSKDWCWFCSGSPNARRRSRPRDREHPTGMTVHALISGAWAGGTVPASGGVLFGNRNSN